MSRANFQPVIRREYGSPKFWIGKLFDQRGGVKIVAEMLGLKDTQTYEFTTPTAKGDIPWSRLFMLSGPKWTAAAEGLAYQCGGVFLPLTVVTNCTALGAKVAETVRANADAVACVVDGMQDGKLTDAERLDAKKKIHAAMGTLAGLLATIDGEAAPPPA